MGLDAFFRDATPGKDWMDEGERAEAKQLKGLVQAIKQLKGLVRPGRPPSDAGPLPWPWLGPCAAGKPGGGPEPQLAGRQE